MSDEISTDDLFRGDEPKPETAPKPAPKRKPAPKPEPKPRRVPVQIDNAVAIRRLDWRCVCGNTSTHSLTRCGKCNSPRYTTE